MKNWIFNVLGSSLLLLCMLAIAAVIMIPKAPIIEKEMAKRNIHIFSKTIEENMLSITWKNPKIFVGNKLVATPSQLDLKMIPKGAKVTITCHTGHAKVKVGWEGNIDIQIKNAKCIKNVGNVNGKITMHQVSTGNYTVDLLNLNIKKNKFSGKLIANGVEMKGRGEIVFNKRNILKSTVNGLFEGQFGKIMLKGTLENLSVKIQ